TRASLIITIVHCICPAIQWEIPSAPKKRGRVLACGQGDVGQLGLGEDVVETSKICFRVWTFGCNDEGALGRATSGESEEGTPGAVRLPAPAVCIAAGDSHSAALLNTGDVYAWGAFRIIFYTNDITGLARQYGAGSADVRSSLAASPSTSTSGRLPSPSPPVETISSYSRNLHNLKTKLYISLYISKSKVLVLNVYFVLQASGGVYTMGCGEQGQLGRLSQRSASRDARQGFSALLVPSKVTLKAGGARIWAGYHATFVLDNNDKMLAWGLNNYGQLGSVVSWGMGSEGQLGTGACNDAAEPTAAVTPALAERTPLHISAGGQHTVLLVEDPTSQKEASPPPESETSEQKGDSQSAESEEEEPKPAKRPKNEQEGEISSTSSAQPSDVGEEAKPQKVNGDEKKETPMEVDETDTPQQKEEDAETETKSADEQTDTEQTEPENTQTEDSKPETTDTSSQETTDSDTKSQEPEKTDVEMSEERTEVNGTPEVVEPKTVDVIPTANPLTTTA
ncbi:hypothetical protein HF086_016122, partial [Spodoptera exigua]